MKVAIYARYSSENQRDASIADQFRVCREFAQRQARFLVTVMLHSGVCLLRQYTAFAGIVHGQKTRKFFAKLVKHRYATA
jgi:predicted site-specific integrase-resolvase